MSRLETPLLSLLLMDHFQEPSPSISAASSLSSILRFRFSLSVLNLALGAKLIFHSVRRLRTFGVFLLFPELYHIKSRFSCETYVYRLLFDSYFPSVFSMLLYIHSMNNIIFAIMRSVTFHDLSVRLLVGGSVGWLVGQLVSRSVGLSGSSFYSNF